MAVQHVAARATGIRSVMKLGCGLPRSIKLIFFPFAVPLFSRVSVLNELLLVNDWAVLGRSTQGWEMWLWWLCTLKSPGVQESQFGIVGLQPYA